VRGPLTPMRDALSPGGPAQAVGSISRRGAPASTVGASVRPYDRAISRSSRARRRRGGRKSEGGPGAAFSGQACGGSAGGGCQVMRRKRRTLRKRYSNSPYSSENMARASSGAGDLLCRLHPAGPAGMQRARGGDAVRARRHAGVMELQPSKQPGDATGAHSFIRAGKKWSLALISWFGRELLFHFRSRGEAWRG
jgi:hypothetical protein